MQISWNGQSCFQIITSQGKNNIVKIVIDPYDEKIGLKVPKLEADIVLVTHDHEDHNNIKAVFGNFVAFKGPGEYEEKEIFITGIPSFHDASEGKERGINTIYIIESEEMRICHLGDLGQKELTDEQLEKIGDVDILMIPVGGTFTIDGSEAVKIMSQIEPKIIIPMHYKIPKLNLKLEEVDKFLKTMGIKSVEPEVKFNIKKKDLPVEEAKIVVLKP